MCEFYKSFQELCNRNGAGLPIFIAFYLAGIG